MSKKYIFDYIVIGAGTAGGVIAKKLTDDKHTSVLVLEAGTNMENSSPSIVTAEVRANDNELSFNILSQTQENIGRQIRLRAGRVIGGSSQHNFMAAVRGSRELYDEWAALVGDQWSYNKICSLFKRNENYKGASQNPNQRGTEGPIFVRQQNIPSNGLIQTLVEATSDVLGIPIEEDYNTGIRDVTSFKTQILQQEVEDDIFIRSSTATGYLNENIVTQGDESDPDEFGVGRRKLVIFAKSTVNKILFGYKKGVKIAVGVEYVKDGVTQRSFARKGIIVSAGIFSSVILQRSGIGNSIDLEKIGVPTLVESPNVGHNFQTQYFVGMGIEVETNRLLQVISSDPVPVTLGAFKKGDGPGRRLQLVGFPVSNFVPIQEVFINHWQFNPAQPNNVMSIAIIDLNPKSKGTITVAHSDPEAYPSITFNPLENPDDLNFVVDQYIETFNIMKKARELDPDGIYKVVFPPENIFNLPNEEEKRNQLAAFAKASYTNFDHFGGHCKMGRNIQEGVVDGFLNVFGTKNLKVADLSIAPILPDGNTSMPAQMIGLNAVRFIREDPFPYVVGDKEIKDYECKSIRDKK
ncbi:GMC family oxidoreductase [Bacillus toyonensis]|uniref:GMC family oxidoreductase n=1 Tax=Bacillus toyonensis TaxID=155322 RepID=UPI0018A1692D|nr:GMC oxidoreductase [Bacillus toyonensis]MBF7148070.1 GMC family oxidoreductase N-terminal domain-containing protein [Bacillus toyonensis]MEC2350265.1 GMC family oxidoreductase N-terminal domain-containing protein [Bacillus toyonensis]MED3188926.1 GMC family oxidoreductase N-terminal domain-containing protein [Bacillus toyonensis]